MISALTKKILKQVLRVINVFLGLAGLELVSKWRLEKLQTFSDLFRSKPAIPRRESSSSFRDYLDTHRQHLKELRAAYSKVAEMQHSVWQPEKVADEVTLDYFRADNMYVYQGGPTGDFQYVLAAQYAKERDTLELFKTLDEDGAFGCYTVKANDSVVLSRDLIDSVLEINFLNRHLDLQANSQTFLDIGAGYGRLAFRLAKSQLNTQHIYCTDGVAESTFLQEYYLSYRKVEKLTSVIPLTGVDTLGPEKGITIACNIHSFPECPLRSIQWWLNRIVDCKIRYFFVVTNREESFLTREPDGERLNFYDDIINCGFALKVKEDKYGEGSILNRMGLFPARYFLFERVLFRKGSFLNG